MAGLEDIAAHLGLGLAVAFSPANVFYCFLGALLGTLIGVLPGLGPATTIAMLLPVTFHLSPIGGLIMLAGIYYGAQYGGSVTSILVNIPGESSSVVTCLDGHAMTRQGRSGAALAIAALGSFFAGCVATVLVALFAPPLTDLVQLFGAAEYFALMLLGLVSAVVLAQGSVLKAVLMILLGLLLGTVGTDVNSGQPRLTFGIAELADGIGFIPLAMGVFGIAEIAVNLERLRGGAPPPAPITRLWPTRLDFRQAWPAILRGTGIGSLLGILPGGGAILGSFASYSLEKRVARDPSRFGNGAIEGVAGPESANNAAAQTSFVPLLTLGIPSNAVMALMIGAMMIHGITPGPMVIDEQPELFWGIIASMWVANLLLVVINLPLVGIWARLTRVPYRILFPAVLMFCAIGAFSYAHSVLDVILTMLFGLLGYVLLKLRCEPAPLILAFVLGPMMEENLRRALLIGRGDPSILVTRPLSGVILALAAILLAVTLLPVVRGLRETAFRED
ncbi:MAG: tripartite tricarboxylate transporter permease [Alphaproteobacteria bacterium]